MQKEAENRVREMQSRARLLGEEKPFPPPPKKQIRPQNPENQRENALGSLFSGMDNDKIIILALLWILWNEKADQKLLLALLYLLLN
ncbi:MAG: hypothetical protein IJE28_01065 [Oscillospiraceae bacterium]|nr:hypothetical protein [Oscillospiraceae bacterium]MBQ3501565.1 hypothetical protein [Oscillospiraceae bacterium]MBQ4547368.1 hypothetical protein [Oscillospiraceae bacterium]MBQ4643035.1 hypothetical protein [Oscillospiraceae bacterium]